MCTPLLKGGQAQLAFKTTKTMCMGTEDIVTIPRETTACSKTGGQHYPSGDILYHKPSLWREVLFSGAVTCTDFEEPSGENMNLGKKSPVRPVAEVAHLTLNTSIPVMGNGNTQTPACKGCAYMHIYYYFKKTGCDIRSGKVCMGDVQAFEISLAFPDLSALLS